MPPSRRITVAIVDDDPSVRHSLDRLCRAFGLAAKAYASGTEFLTALHTGGPLADCLVLDAHMPEMSGAELLQCLQARGVRIPTIVFTADDAPETLVQQAAGAVAACLRKPTSAEALLSAIAQVTSVAPTRL
jgi:FixJ family two-component response regulator